MSNKTHWLQNPNKNYLGHWDLPTSSDLILTIKTAQWEEVKNPITNKSEACRVVRFKEDVKPLIVNQTNANSILNATGARYMEDSTGLKIALFIDVFRDRRSKEDIDCIRIRNTKPIIEKIELIPGCDKWDDAKKAVQNTGTTLEAIRKYYSITDENWKILCG